MARGVGDGFGHRARALATPLPLPRDARRRHGDAAADRVRAAAVQARARRGPRALGRRAVRRDPGLLGARLRGEVRGPARPRARLGAAASRLRGAAPDEPARGRALRRHPGREGAGGAQRGAARPAHQAVERSADARVLRPLPHARGAADAPALRRHGRRFRGRLEGGRLRGRHAGRHDPHGPPHAAPRPRRSRLPRGASGRPGRARGARQRTHPGRGPAVVRARDPPREEPPRGRPRRAPQPARRRRR